MDAAMQDEWQDNARMILESARALVPPDGSLARIRKARFAGCGYDRAMVARAAELGLLLIWVAEEEGGLDLGLRETCELMRVLGGGLVPEPILSAMTAAALLQGDLPEPAMTGEAVIVTAWQDRGNALDWRGGATEGRLSGTKVHVSGAAGADLFAVTTAEGVAVVARDAPGLTVETDETLDGGRTGTLTFADVQARLVPCNRIDAIIQDATLAHSAYLLGVSERAFGLTLDHLRMREQFGRPIGSFQSLQHRATEMKIQLELSRAGILATARRFDQGAGPAARIRGAARCKHRAAELAMLVAREAVQMHGAMGITDEADIGLFVRKAMTEANLYGSARTQRAVLATLPGEDAA